MALIRLGLMHAVSMVPSDPLDPSDRLRLDNPLGKMPVLVLEDGNRILDSRVILDYLDRRSGGGVLIPEPLDTRAACLTRQALCNGVIDAALLMVYETRHRPPALYHEPWVEFQRDKISRSLGFIETDLDDPTTFNVGTIATACMLGYLDWRKQLVWRQPFPRLVSWLDAFRRHHPEFDLTEASQT
jgi:glutathione S-transferase